MNWYIGKLIFRIVCGTGEHKAQFDEQVRLFWAASMQEALEKAHQTGAAESVCFPNQHQQLVHWQFLNVTELYMLPAVADGAELYSRIEECDQATDYEALVQTKARYIAAQISSLQPT